MGQSRIERILARDRRVVAVALLALVGLSWWYLYNLSAEMSSPMGGMVMALAPWSATDWVLMILMWAIMMVGMMLPSAAPMVLLFAGLRRKRGESGRKIATEVAVFTSGYLAMWAAFSVLATALQWALEHAALLSPMMVSNSLALNGGILIAAGLYQFLPVKDACLAHCRAPAHFLSQHWRPGAAGAFRMGAHHGAYCLGCCWVLMALLFVGGVMNLLWIAVIAGVVFIEKLAPRGDIVGVLFGAALAVAGLAFILVPASG